MSYPRGPIEPRFLAKVEKTSGCWVWNGSRCKNGYGRTWDGYKPVLAHRLAYNLWVGEIPEGLEIDHTCKNRSCVNPAHLEPVTHQVNKARSVGTVCPNGHPRNEQNKFYNTYGIICCRPCHREGVRRARQRRMEKQACVLTII